MKSFNFLKKGMLIGILALAMSSLGLFAKGTPAGTWIISTNTWATYSNTGLTAGWSTNNTNTGLSNLVLAVHGFSNYTAQYATNTNSVLAGSTYYYPIWVSNHGNFSNNLLVSAGSNYNGVAHGADWLLSYVDTNSNALTANPTNIAADEAFRYMVKVVVDPAAQDGSLLRVVVTNQMLAGAIFGYASPSNGQVFYGGTNFETNTINLLVGGPKLILNKVYTVLDPAGGSQVIPGAIITFTIAYTNIGSGIASNVVINDYLDNAYLHYLVNSTNTITGATVAYDHNNGGTFGIADATANTATAGWGSVNTNLTGLRYSIPSVAGSSAGGVIVYKAVVR